MSTYTNEQVAHLVEGTLDWETTFRMLSMPKDQGRFAQSLAEVGTPGFTIYDIRAFWQATKRLLLTAGVENVGNKNYREHLDLRTGTVVLTSPTGQVQVGPGLLQPGVNFYFGAQLTY